MDAYCYLVKCLVVICGWISWLFFVFFFCCFLFFFVFGVCRTKQQCHFSGLGVFQQWVSIVFCLVSFPSTNGSGIAGIKGSCCSIKGG